MTDRADLKRLADAATPGPWETNGSTIEGAGRFVVLHVDRGVQTHADVEYIAAVDPDTVKRLLDEFTDKEGQVAYAMDRELELKVRLAAMETALTDIVSWDVDDGHEGRHRRPCQACQRVFHARRALDETQREGSAT